MKTQTQTQKLTRSVVTEKYNKFTAAEIYFTQVLEDCELIIKNTTTFFVSKSKKVIVEFSSASEFLLIETIEWYDVILLYKLGIEECRSVFIEVLKNFVENIIDRKILGVDLENEKYE